uniref:Diphthamide biosynthesis protein 3 n=1 Tax=Gallus gallus TaxID=9031 RepID=A0A8V0XF03_CHICK
MAVFHDEVEIEDFEYDEETETYSYPCPCGDRFLITREDLENGEDVATCPSCSLILRVIYDQRGMEFYSSGVRPSESSVMLKSCPFLFFLSCHSPHRSYSIPWCFSRSIAQLSCIVFGRKGGK